MAIAYTFPQYIYSYLINLKKEGGHMKRTTLSIRKMDGAFSRRSGLLAALCFASLQMFSSAAIADSKDGVFPTAEQVGGQVYPDPIKVGAKFPTDIEIYDTSGKAADFGKLIAGKRTVLVFFISAVPVSVNELKKIQDFMAKNAPATQVLALNTDTVGTALMGISPIDGTARTLNVIKQEKGITMPMYVAPNDALSPAGLSNRLGFRGLPTIFVLTANGLVEKTFVGPQNWKRGDI